MSEIEQVRQLLARSGCPDYVSTVAMVSELLEHRQTFERSVHLNFTLLHLLKSLINEVQLDTHQTELVVRGKRLRLAEVLSRIEEEMGRL